MARLQEELVSDGGPVYTFKRAWWENRADACGGHDVGSYSRPYERDRRVPRQDLKVSLVPYVGTAIGYAFR
jgi:hypothetical protein